MSLKAIKYLIDNYQRQRLCFIQTVSTHANKPKSIKILTDFHILDLIIPLLQDPIPSVKHAALTSLGKIICNKDSTMLQCLLIEKQVLPLILKDLSSQSVHYKKATLYIMKCLSQRDTKFIELIIDNNGLKILYDSLEHVDKTMKETATMTLGFIAKNNKKFAKEIVNSAITPLLIQNLQLDQLSLKHATVFAIDNICKHSSKAADYLSKFGVIPLLLDALNKEHAKLKQECLACLANLSKHSPVLAEMVITKYSIPIIIEHLKYPCDGVQKNAAILLRDISKHNLQLVNVIVQHDAIDGLLDFIEVGKCKSPAIMALGYIAAQSEQFASFIIEKKGIEILGHVLCIDNDEVVQTSTIWTLSQIGKHSVHHTDYICQLNLLSEMLNLYYQNSSSEYLKNRCKSALNILLLKCNNTKQLEALLLEGCMNVIGIAGIDKCDTSSDIPEDLLTSVFCAFIKILPNDSIVRRNFVTSGCLKIIQLLKLHTSNLDTYINFINGCFPGDLVEYVSPGYSQQLMERIDQYVPTHVPENYPDCNVTPSSSDMSVPKSHEHDSHDGNHSELSAQM